MDTILEKLHGMFYIPPEMAKVKTAIEANHRLLIERLDKPERKLVLRIIDDKDRIAGELSLDSFICGFKLAWRLANELNNYNEGHSTSTMPVGLDGLSASVKGEEPL